MRRLLSFCKRIVRRMLRIVTLSDILYKTEWYKGLFVGADHQTYPDNYWYREHDERNFDVVNLGSSSAKWAYCYDESGVKAMNWAQQPQTLLEDFNLLRHYHSILRKGGYVLITIMPFTGVNKKTGVLDSIKYMKLETQGEAIQPYLADMAIRYSTYPILLGRPAISALLRFIMHKEVKYDRAGKWSSDNNYMDEAQLQADAKRWMAGWKRQFNITTFEEPLTEENLKGRKYRIDLMQKIVDFCSERGYKPVYVIPPVTEHLAKEFTTKFCQIYIYDYLKQVGRDVKLLDYLKDTRLMNKDYYQNSFFMNRKGARAFTKKVLTDLGIIKVNSYSNP